VTKARACKGVGQEGSPGVTFYALGNAGKCEEMDPHILKSSESNCTGQNLWD